MDTAHTELDNLAGLAAAADQGAVAADIPPGAEQQEPEGPNYANEAAGAVDLFAAMVVGYCPPAERIWTDQKKKHIAAVLAPVMEKHGFTLGNLPPELALLLVAGPPLFQTAKLIAQQRADEPKTPDNQATPAAPATPQATGNEPGVHSQVSLYNHGR